MKINLKSNETLVLRTCNANGVSYNNFRWPKRGPVKCPDWKPTKECGNGLHGALMGSGNGALFDWNCDALWQVVKVNKDEIIILDGKVKFPKGYVYFTGDRKTATDIIIAHGGIDVIGATVTVKNCEIAVVGYNGVATAGSWGTATAGTYGTAKAGDGGTAAAGDYGTAAAGDYGTAKAGAYGTAKAGAYGTAKAGAYGTATAGKLGIAMAGDYGTAITDGLGAAKAGNGGMIQIKFWDEDNKRYRLAVGYIGENGLEPNVKYELDRNKNFVRVD